MKRTTLWQLAIIGGLLAAFNSHLFSNAEPQHFLASNVMAGEWWRVLVHPFVHVTPYHLLVDGIAFVALWFGLRSSLPRKLLVLASSLVGSLVAVLLAAPEVFDVGFGGLSGIAHGLMAVAGVELMSRRDRTERIVGTALFLIVLAKSLVELVTGTPFFASMHLGELGTPLVVSHLGGVIGGTLAMVAKRGQSRVSLASVVR